VPPREKEKNEKKVLCNKTSVKFIHIMHGNTYSKFESTFLQ